MLGKRFIRLRHIKIFETVQKIKQKNCLEKSSRIWLLICPVTYWGSILWYSWLLFSFILLLNFCQLYEQGKVNIVSMFRFLEIDIREQKKYEVRTQRSVDMKSSLKIVWKTKITFLWSDALLFFLEQKYILFSETYFFRIPKNLITSTLFCRGRY